MERRSRSLEALNQIIYIDSLDDDLRAERLAHWSTEYLVDTKIEEFDLEIEDLEKLSELFYKNVIFLKKYINKIQSDLKEYNKIKEFLNE